MPPIVKQALDRFVPQARPRRQVRNPVMFVVYVGQHPHDRSSVPGAGRQGEAPPGSSSGVSVWLWFTVLFANFAEAMAEGRGKAQADSLRKARRDVHGQAAVASGPDARRTTAVSAIGPAQGRRGAGRRRRLSSRPTARSSRASPRWTRAPSPARARRSSARAAATAARVTGGTQVLSDWLVVRGHRQPRRDVPRPHDRAGRGRQAAEDAQRDRARYPARGADDHLPAGHAPPCCRSRSTVSRRPARARPVTRDGPGRPARLPDPDHDRRRCCPPSASPAWTA